MEKSRMEVPPGHVLAENEDGEVELHRAEDFAGEEAARAEGPLLSRSQILALGAGTRAVERVHIPEWGGDVFVRELDASGVGKLQEATTGKNAGSMDNVLKVVALCVCDEGLNPLFRMGDLPEMRALGFAPMKRLQDVALRLNGFEEDDASGN